MNPFFGHARLPEYVPRIPASSNNLAGWRSASMDTFGYELVPTQHQPSRIAQPSKAPRIPPPPPTKPYVPRIAKACVKCNRRKHRCTGGERCQRCVDKGLECVYPAKTKKPVATKQRADSRSGASSSDWNFRVVSDHLPAPFDFGPYGNELGLLSTGSFLDGSSSSGPSSASSPAYIGSSSSDVSSLNSRRSSMTSADSSFCDFGYPDSQRSSMAGPARTSRRSSRAHPYSSAAPTTAQPQYAFDIDATIDELFPSGLASFCVPSSNAGNSSLPSADLFAELDPYCVPSQY